MAKAAVADYLERARCIADVADKRTGDEKKRLLEMADAWFKLANIVMNEAVKSAPIPGDYMQHPKPH
jgi:hypothetical protein